MIFNSLGSNYSGRQVWANLVKFGTKKDVSKLKKSLSQQFGVDSSQIYLYSDGRGALEEAIKLIGTGRVASNTFSCFAVEQAIVKAGGQVCFLDSNPKATNPYHFSLKELKAVKEKLKAVVVQNSFGWPVEIKKIEDYCQKKSLFLIEDLAQSPFGQYPDGRLFGQVGDLVILSFGRDKLADTVGGGVLIVRQKSLLKNNRPLQPKTSLAGFLNSLKQRLYPLLSAAIRGGHKFGPFGKIEQTVFFKTGLISRSSQKQCLEAMSRSRSGLIYSTWQNLKKELTRRQKLIAIYSQKEVDRNLGLARYPLRLPTASNRRLCLKDLAKNGFHLNDNWYDWPVYPRRQEAQSSYRIGSCLEAEKISKTIINLPLHRKISPAKALEIKSIVEKYQQFILEENPKQKDYQAAAKKLKPNLLVDYLNGQALKTAGYPVSRCLVSLAGQENIKALAQVVFYKARRGRYLEIAGGPLWQPSQKKPPEILVSWLVELAKKRRAIFIRLQPFYSPAELSADWEKNFQAQPAKKEINAPTSLVIDLNEDLEKIWAKFERKIRTSIRNTKKKGLVKVTVEKNQETQEEILKLLAATSRRQNFRTTPLKIIRAQLQEWAKNDQLKIYQAKSNDGQIIASAAIFYSFEQAVYLYGASRVELNRRYRASYLLQAEIIKEAQAAGFKTYDFWGVSRPDEKGPLAAVSHFKTRFSKNYYQRSQSQDIVLRPISYWFLSRFESLEKWRQKRR